MHTLNVCTLFHFSVIIKIFCYYAKYTLFVMYEDYIEVIFMLVKIYQKIANELKKKLFRLINVNVNLIVNL